MIEQAWRGWQEEDDYKLAHDRDDDSKYSKGSAGVLNKDGGMRLVTERGQY